MQTLPQANFAVCQMQFFLEIHQANILHTYPLAYLYKQGVSLSICTLALFQPIYSTLVKFHLPSSHSQTEAFHNNQTFAYVLYHLNICFPLYILLLQQDEIRYLNQFHEQLYQLFSLYLSDNVLNVALLRSAQ